MDSSTLAILVGVFVALIIIGQWLFGAWAIYQTKEAANDGRFDAYDIESLFASLLSTLPSFGDNPYVVEGFVETYARLPENRRAQIDTMMKMLLAGEEFLPEGTEIELLDDLQMLIEVAKRETSSDESL